MYDKKTSWCAIISTKKNTMRAITSNEVLNIYGLTVM